MELVKIRFEDLKPYENNPRYNDEAIGVVEDSIEMVGYITPIIVDEDNRILAGHTRYRALFNLALDDEVECIVVRGLSDEQKRKFRLLDNKTAEIANWDLKKLEEELDGLDFDYADYFAKEIEKMADNVLKVEEKTEKVIVCPRCGKLIVGLVDLENYDE